MGTYARPPIARKEPEERPEKGLGETLEGVGDELKLGDLLSGEFDEADIDSVEAVRELREDE